MAVCRPTRMELPLFPDASTRLSRGSVNVPSPFATEALTTKVPTKTEPGTVPERVNAVEVPSFSWNVSGPGRITTGTEVVIVTVTFPAAVGEGSLRTRLAEGAATPWYSRAPMSHGPTFGALPE